MRKKKTISTYKNYFETLNEMEPGAGCTAKGRQKYCVGSWLIVQTGYSDRIFKATKTV